MKKQLIIIFALVSILGVSRVQAQLELDEPTCPEYGTGPEHENIDIYRINSFVRSVNNGTHELFNETVTISEEEINPVTDVALCERMSTFLIENDYANNKIFVGSVYQRFYYQTNDYVYVFWTSKNPIGGGPKLKFLVIKKDFSAVQKFYL